MKLPTDLTLDEVVSALRRCKNETQLYGCFEALTRNDMKFWPDSCYQDCTELLREAMGNPELPLYPFVNLQDEFEHTVKLFLTRTWVGLESKKDLPITDEEIKAVEKSAEEVKLDVYKDMLKDILNNGAEYECRYCGQGWRGGGIWEPVDITEGYKMGYEYRKKQPKTWMEENVGDNTPRLEAIKDFYEEFMKRIKNLNTWDGGRKIMIDDLKCIAKEMGVEVDD